MLGALVEKELTTPQGYPLTDSALLAACNQTTSRDPVVVYDTAVLRPAVRSLREQGLLRTVHRTGERSDKHRHELADALDLSQGQVALLGLLLLRGPQTLAELRARAERWYAFGSVEDVEQEMSVLLDRDLAVRLDRQPGRKEARYAQVLAASGVVPSPAATAAPPAPATRQVPPAPATDQAPPAPATPTPATPTPAAAAPAGLADEVAALREEVAALREEVARLTELLD